MSRLGRLGAMIAVVLGMLTFVGVPMAHADCSNPTDPDFGQCSFPPAPSPTTTPKATPKPTTGPTSAPGTPAPTRRPVTRTSAPVVHTNPGTPEPTPFDVVEVPQEGSLATPKIVVNGPVNDDSTNFEVAQPAGGVSNWIFGFIFGFIVGGFVGRASWGLRKRRRQQIFG